MCKNFRACLGAPNFLLDRKDVYVNASTNNTESCGDGYINPPTQNIRCTSCQEGYIDRTGSMGCEKCEKGTMTVLIVGLLAVLIMFIILIALRLRSTVGRRKDQTSIIKRTLLTHLQMVSIVMGLNVPWPHGVTVAMDALSVFTSVSSHTSSIQCSDVSAARRNAQVHYATLIAAALLPFATILFTYIYWFGCVPHCRILSCGKKVNASPWCPKKNCFKLRQKNRQPVSNRWVAARNKLRAVSVFSTTDNAPPPFPEEKVSEAETEPETETKGSKKKKKKKKKKSKLSKPPTKSTRDGWIITNILLLWMLTPSILRSAFEILHYITICDVRYWTLDENIEYNSKQHQLMIQIVAMPSLLCFGAIFPLLGILYIGRHRDRQRNKKLIFRFGLVYSGYSANLWWWELVVHFRKVAMILIVTFADTNQQQLHIALGALIVLLYIQEQAQPFAPTGLSKMTAAASATATTISKKLHRLETLSLLVLITMVWSAVFFTINTCDDQDVFCSMLGIFVLSVNVIFTLFVAIVFAYEFCKKHQEKVVKLSKALSNLKSTMRQSFGESHGHHHENELANNLREIGERGELELVVNPMRRQEEKKNTQRNVVDDDDSEMEVSKDGRRGRERKIEITIKKTKMKTKSRLKSKRTGERKEEIQKKGDVELMVNPVVKKAPSLITVHVDKSTGRSFNYNSATGESVWLDVDDDEHVSIVESKPTRKPTSKQRVRRLSKVMKARRNSKSEQLNAAAAEATENVVSIEVDEGTGRRYSYNSATEESVWLDLEDDEQVTV